jgi:cyclic-di-GMP-binding protein
LSYGKVEEAAKGRVRQTVTLNVGISTDKGREIGKFLKDLNLKGVSHQVQGDQLRVSGKKKDDLQAAIQAMRDHDFGIPLQFENYRD